MQKTYIIFGIILLLVAVGVYYYYTQYQKEPPIPPPQGTTVEEEGGLGSELFEQVDTAPTNQIPDTNPFDGNTGAVNPFGETKTNPFKDVYQNPFGN